MARGEETTGPSGGGTAGASPALGVTAAMQAVDWGATSVGERESWPAALQTMVRVMLGSRFAMWMGWGPELSFFYNDAYARDTLDKKHPWALGQPASRVWEEIWDDIGPRIEHVLATGEATWDQNLLLFLERSGFSEETYHTFSYSPLFDADAVVGMLCVVSETTEEVVGDRRMATLRELAAALSACTSEADVVRAVGECLGSNPHDLPFSLTYLASGDGAQGAELVTASGVDAGHAIAPAHIDLAGDAPWTLVGATSSVDGLPELAADLPTGAWEQPPRQALLVPINESGQEQPTGVLVVGVNPFRPLDESYLGFVELVAGQIGSAISSARAFEAERRRSEALAALDQAKTTFFTNISHEFRTPLTLLLAPLEQSLTTPLDADNRERLALAHRNALRLLKLVNALLDFSRLEAGRLRASLEPLDLAAETADVAGMFRSAIETGGLAFVVDCPPLGQPVLADRNMWELIVTNLLSNAFKHTFRGAIEVRLALVDDHVQLDVVDTGIGIADDQIPHLFGRFHRVEGAASRSHEGSGVGLSLVRELVELHGGRVSVQSRLGAGTTFRVEIPALSADDVAAARHSPGHEGRPVASRNLAAHLAEVQQWVSRTPEETTDAVPPTGTVLVVDDNADMRSYVARLLSSRFRVRTAIDGADALEQIRSQVPDVVVSDVMMPNVDGLELVRTLRADRSLVDLPVVLLSARAGPEASIEGLDLGADDYLVKPFSADELIGRVAARYASSRERRRSRIVGRLTDELRGVRDLDGVAAAVQRVTGEMLGSALASVSVRDADLVRNHFAPRLGHGLDDRFHVLDEGSQAPPAVTARTGRSIAVADADEFERAFPDFAEDHRTTGLEALVAVPLRDRLDERVGAFVLAWNAPRRVDDDTRRMVDAVAEVVARALDRIQTARREARVAEQIQSQLLELGIRPRNGVVAARYRPADSTLVVGGDWYDAIAIDDERLGLAVGDVVGSGLPAALVMGQLRSALAAAAAGGAPPDQVIGIVDAFARRLPGALCTTAAYCLVERDDPRGPARLRWTCAGHPPPVVVDEGVASLLWDGRRAPLGVSDARSAPVESLEIGPGSLVVLYTDGLVERRRAGLDDRLELLREAVARHAARPVGEFCDRLIADLAPAGSTTDDLAVIAFRLSGATDDCFVDVISAASREVGITRRRLREWLERGGVAEDDVDTVLLAVGEAVANAVEHGSRRHPERRVGIEVHRSGADLVVAITDTGAWDRDASTSVHDSRGRGFRIMHELAERVAVDRSRLGSTVTMELRLRTVHDESTQASG